VVFMGLRVYEMIVVGLKSSTDAFEVVRFLAFYLCPPFSPLQLPFRLKGYLTLHNYFPNFSS